jgi:hypothetical protein
MNAETIERPHARAVPGKPPASHVLTVLAHLQTTRRALAALHLEIPERAFAAATGRPDGKENLAALREKIAAAEFEIECNSKAREVAAQIDQKAIAAWKAAVQTLEPEEIIAGITKDACCGRCGAGHGCVITGADALAGPCAHPVLVGALELTRYTLNPKITAVYAAACVKLGLRIPK